MDTHLPALAISLFGEKGCSRPNYTNPKIVGLLRSIISNSWATFRTSINRDLERINKISTELEDKWESE